MIAKLVTHAPTRAAAIDAQARALDAFYIDGIRHNIPFLSAVMHNPRWRAGRLSTGFIAEEFPNGFHPIVPQGEQARLIAAVAAAIDHVIGERKRRISGQMGGRLVTRQRRRAVWLGDVEMALSVVREDRQRPALIENGAEGPARILTSAWKPGEPVWTGTVHGTPAAVQVRPILNGFQLAHGGVEVKAFVYTEREAAAARLMPNKPPSLIPAKSSCVRCRGSCARSRSPRGVKSKPAIRLPWSKP